MGKKKSPFRGLLRQRIDLSKAPATGLRAQFGAPPDENDLIEYARDEARVRWTQFDKQFGLDDKRPDIWKQRAHVLAGLFIPGFWFKKPDRHRQGAPAKWSDLLLMQLFADVEYEKQKTGHGVRKICEENLRRGVYRQRWGSFKPTTLRGGYQIATKRKNQPTVFYLELFGPEAPMTNRKNTLIECAIKRHALKSKQG